MITTEKQILLEDARAWGLYIQLSTMLQDWSYIKNTKLVINYNHKEIWIGLELCTMLHASWAVKNYTVNLCTYTSFLKFSMLP